MIKFIKKEIVIKYVLIALACLLPIFTIIYLIHKYAQNVPQSDAWGIYAYYYIIDGLKEAQNKILFMSHNGGIHRKIIPTFIAAIILKITRFNLIAINYFVVLVNLGNALLMYIIFSTLTNKKNNSLKIYMLPLFTVFTFSVTMWPFWVNSLMIEHCITIFTFLMSLYFLIKKSCWLYFIIAVISALLASISFFPGNLIWVLFPILFIFFNYNKLRYYLIWGVSSLVVLIPNIKDYLMGSHSSSVGKLEFSLIKMIKFLLAFVGGFFKQSFKGDDLLLVYGGYLTVIMMLGMICFFFHRNRKLFKSIIPWVIIAIWVLINGSFAAIGRTHLNEIHYSLATPTRYSTFSMIFIVSLIGMCLTYLFNNDVTMSKKLNVIITENLTSLLFLFFVVSFCVLYGTIIYNQVKSNYYTTTTSALKTGYENVEYYLVADDAKFSMLFPWPDITRSYIYGLKKKGVYPDPATDLPISHAIVNKNEISEIVFNNNDGSRTLYTQPFNIYTGWHVFFPRILPNVAQRIQLRTGYLNKPDLHQKIDEFIITVLKDGKSLDEFRFPLENVSKDTFIPIHIDLNKYTGNNVFIVFKAKTGFNTEGVFYWFPPKFIFD